MLIRQSEVVILLLTMSACGRAEGQSVAELVRGTPPLDGLDDVSLGMSLSELRRVRPEVEQLEDFLYAEETTGYTLAYVFPLRPPMGPEPRLKEVAAQQEFTAEAPAREAWGALLRSAESALGTPHRCQRWSTSFVESDAAIWETDGRLVTAALARSLGQGNLGWTFLVVLRVGEDEEDEQNDAEPGARTPLPCSSLLNRGP